jgi:hypothetical protein
MTESDQDDSITLQATSEKEVNKRDSEEKEGDSYYHTKLKAKNSERVDWVKVKTTGDQFCEPDDEFKLKDIEGQTSLEDLTEDNDLDEEMEG